MKQTRFEVLDGLRGLAALFVIAVHVPPYSFTGWAPGAFLAVDFFFVLSGFVLAHAYEGKLSAGMSTVEFMTRRLIRLWPLYAAGLALGMVGGLARGRGDVVSSGVLGALMVPRVWNGPDMELYPLNFPAWSLLFELVANLVFALLARRLTNVILAGLMASGLAMTLAHGNLDSSVVAWAWLNMLGRVMLSFFAGVALYRLHRRFPARRFPALVSAIGLVAVFVAPWPWLGLLVLSPALVYVAASAKAEGPIRALCFRLGAASYGVYVLHAPLIWLWDLAVPGEGGAAVLTLTAVSAITLAILLDRSFDVPVRMTLERTVLPLVARCAAPVLSGAADLSRNVAGITAGRSSRTGT